MRLFTIGPTVLAALATATFGVPAPAAAAPSAPERLHTTSVTATSVSLSWLQNMGTQTMRARVYQNGVLAATTPLIRYTATGLVPGATYSFHVVAVDAAGHTSAPSRTVTITTRGAGVVPPGATDLRAVEITPARVTLAWQQPDDSWDIASYQVFDGATQIGYVSAYPVRGIPTVSFMVRELAPGSRHSYTVRAFRHEIGSAPPSNPVNAALPGQTDVDAPSVPADFSVRRAVYSCFAVNMTWGQSTDNVDAQAAIDYQVFVNGVFYVWMRGTGATFKGDMAFGLSTITIRSVDSSGNASASASATFFRPDWCTDDM
jgi:hypothetical protein